PEPQSEAEYSEIQEIPICHLEDMLASSAPDPRPLFFDPPAPTDNYTLSLHDALPILLGFHKQMDNRIKLLEEILSFRMQGVEFDNGDMYVDGHKAASDVRDEFVSVTEKLMDELAQCYNVLPQLDINNTIDHRPEG